MPIFFLLQTLFINFDLNTVLQQRVLQQVFNGDLVYKLLENLF